VVTAKTSCLLVVVKDEIAVAKINENPRVIQAIRMADTFADRKMKIGIKRSVVDALTIIISTKNLPKLAKKFSRRQVSIVLFSYVEDQKNFLKFSA
jgi:hypothetical protein